MSSQQGAQTWITAEGENSQRSFAKKYEITIDMFFGGEIQNVDVKPYAQNLQGPGEYRSPHRL